MGGAGSAAVTRLAARQDTTHGAIRDGLRALGMLVIDTSSAGYGLPDMIVGARNGTSGLWIFVEAKGPRGHLTVRQRDIADAADKAGAPYVVARALDEALAGIEAAIGREVGAHLRYWPAEGWPDEYQCYTKRPIR